MKGPHGGRSQTLWRLTPLLTHGSPIRSSNLNINLNFFLGSNPAICLKVIFFSKAQFSKAQGPFPPGFIELLLLSKKVSSSLHDVLAQRHPHRTDSWRYENLGDTSCTHLERGIVSSGEPKSWFALQT